MADDVFVADVVFDTCWFIKLIVVPNCIDADMVVICAQLQPNEKQMLKTVFSYILKCVFDILPVYRVKHLCIYCTATCE